MYIATKIDRYRLVMFKDIRILIVQCTTFNKSKKIFSNSLSKKNIITQAPLLTKDSKHYIF